MTATTTATTTATRSYTTSTPQWQRFQTSLMAPAHAVAAHNHHNNKTNQVAPPPHVYSRQYAVVYYQRYQQLAPYCWQAIEHHHHHHAADNNNNNNCTDKRVNRIVELAQQQPHKHKNNKINTKNTNKHNNDEENNNNVLYWVVGTLVKETMDATEPPLVGQHVRASDTLFLEDDSGRVTLEFPNIINNDGNNHATGVVNQHAWPTGAVVAVQGRLGPDGTLRVTQIVPPAPSLAVDNNKNNDDDDVVMTHATTTTTTQQQQQPCYLMLVSGLDCGGANVPATTRDLLLHFLQGRLACSSSCAVAPHQIAALLVAGGWAARTRQGLQDADAWCDQVLAAGIPCHVLPGQSDATTANWPQRPLHQSCTPRCSRKYRSSTTTTLFHATPNPYQATWGGGTIIMDDDKNTDRHLCPTQPVTVWATDGFNVRAQQDVTAVVVQPQPSSSSSNNNKNKDTHSRDLLYNKPTALQVMQQHLALRHLCPVGPAIVPTMPHAQSDPMVLPPAPSCRCLYVTGGHDTFSTSTSSTTTGSGGVTTTTTTRLVAVPKFSTTGTAVLVELQSLQVQVLKFVDETE